MIWTCETFDRWLDDGRPGGGEAAAHAERCPRCAAALSAARAVEEALAVPPSVAAPAGFTDAVIRRLGPARALAKPPRMSWWTRAIRHPAFVPTAAMTLITAWCWPALSRLSGDSFPRIAGWIEAAARLPLAAVLAVAPPHVFDALRGPRVELALALALAPAVLWASWKLFRRLERAAPAPLARAAAAS